MENKSDAKLDTKKLSVFGLILIIFPVVFGFNNSAVAFYKMGYASIIWYILGAITFFLPLMFIIAEYAFSFKNSEGGIQSWMSNAKGSYFGFVVTFIFYFAQLFWMVNFSTTRIWIPLSCGLFGYDTTSNWSFLGFSSTQVIGLLAIMFILTITFVATKGLDKVTSVAKIGGIACMSINVILFTSAIIIALLKLFKGDAVFVEPINGINTFLIPPIPSAANLVTIVSFMSFATFAYAGSETLGSLANKTETEKTFSNGILYSSVFIMIGYSLAIFLWGVVQNCQVLNETSIVNFGNVLYYSMSNLGNSLGEVLGLNQILPPSFLATFFARITGIALFLTTLGAFFAVIYAPLQAILQGAPKNLFPDFLMKKNKNNINQNAMFLQAAIVCTIIFIISFGGKSASDFYELIISMANIAQTCPYIFIFLSFPAFRNNEKLNHDFTIFKSKFSVNLASFTGFLVVLIANLLLSFQPILTNEPNGLTKTTFMLCGPLLFIFIGMLIYKNYEKRNKVSN